jgi:hypothetical protein
MFSYSDSDATGKRTQGDATFFDSVNMHGVDFFSSRLVIDSAKVGYP